MEIFVQLVNNFNLQQYPEEYLFLHLDPSHPKKNSDQECHPGYDTKKSQSHESIKCSSKRKQISQCYSDYSFRECLTIQPLFTSRRSGLKLFTADTSRGI
jgi:hypothetical protein